MGMCWEGATTQRATARKVEQRPQRAPGRLSRACSAVTQQVNAFVGKKVKVYSHLQRKLSGQLPFLGSKGHFSIWRMAKQRIVAGWSGGVDSVVLYDVRFVWGWVIAGISDG